MLLHFSRYTHRFVLRHRLLLLLCTLLTLITAFPFVKDILPRYLAVMELSFTLILLFGIYLVTDNKKLLTVTALIALLATSIIFFNIFLQSKSLLLLGLYLEIIFFIITAFAIIRHVLGYKRVTADKIYGAICGYLILGMIWTLIYITIEIVNPESFRLISNQIRDYGTYYTHRYYFSDFIYYSFVTLSTLGYGDIVPVSTPARIFSALEAITGQLYVAVFIARLVGLHISHSFFMRDK